MHCNNTRKSINISAKVEHNVFLCFFFAWRKTNKKPLGRCGLEVGTPFVWSMFLDIIRMDRWYKVSGNILSICNTEQNAHTQLRWAVFVSLITLVGRGKQQSSQWLLFTTVILSNEWTSALKTQPDRAQFPRVGFRNGHNWIQFRFGTDPIILGAVLG